MNLVVMGAHQAGRVTKMLFGLVSVASSNTQPVRSRSFHCRLPNERNPPRVADLCLDSPISRVLAGFNQSIRGAAEGLRSR